VLETPPGRPVGINLWYKEPEGEHKNERFNRAQCHLRIITLDVHEMALGAAMIDESKLLHELGSGFHGGGGGLYLMVQKSGKGTSRAWVLRVVVNGRRRNIGLGSLKRVTLDQARERAELLRQRARAGLDIIKERKAEKRVVPSFKQAALIVYEREKQTFRSAQHAHNWLQSLELHVFPVIGSKRVDELTIDDLERVFAPMWTKTPDTARRTLRRVRKVFDYVHAKAYRVGLEHPCNGLVMILPHHKLKRETFESLPYNELPKFIGEMRKAGNARKSSASLSVSLGFEFLVLTVSRVSEVTNAKWTEIDMEAKTWTLPAARTKTNKTHRVPLSNSALEILKFAKDFLIQSEYVFPGPDGGPLSVSAFLMRLRRMGHEQITCHGFRATFKTYATEQTNFNWLVIESCLAHTVPGVERNYLRTDFFDERRKLLEQWAAFAVKGV
jgi:integrase